MILAGKAQSVISAIPAVIANKLHWRRVAWKAIPCGPGSRWPTVGTGNNRVISNYVGIKAIFRSSC